MHQDKFMDSFNKVLIALLLLMTSCVPVTTNSNQNNLQRLIFDNVDYSVNVRLVQVFPGNYGQNSMQNPVFDMKRDPSILLSFDLSEENYENLYASFIHCNANWRPSGLPDIRFLDDYNSFPIDKFEYSANTRIPYVHYESVLPVPTIAGNYIIKVFRDTEDDLVLTRKVIVYENNVVIEPSPQLSTNLQRKDELQQINFSVNYEKLGNINALGDLKFIILQNHQWLTAVSDLQPSSVRNDLKTLEFRLFDLKNNFPGINEFRFFDLRTVDYRAMNVSRVIKTDSVIEAYINLDQPRNNLAYTQIHEDLNGNYYLENQDPNDSFLESEYVRTHFKLLSDKIDGQVYVAGRFNNWRIENSNRLTYNTDEQAYMGSFPLKQGYYNYMYWVQSDNLPYYYFEGSKFQTENEYEILCYFRNPANNYEELVGYKKITVRF